MRSHIGTIAVLAGLMGFTSPAAWSGEAAVLDVTARANADGTYAFNVTVAHGDEGWAHYANKWEILAPDGKILGERILYHPHVDEQPFTRSLGRVEIPIGVNEVEVVAFDSVHGKGSRTFKVTLPPRK